MQTSVEVAGHATQRKRDTRRDALMDPESFATTLLVVARDVLSPEEGQNPMEPGADFWHWTKETIRDELGDVFGGIEIPELNLDKLMAAIAIVSTDLFYHDTRRFIILANVLCGTPFQPDVLDLADVAECAWAVTEAYLLDPFPEGQSPYAPEIADYVGFMLSEEGFVRPPGVLSELGAGSDVSAKMSQEWSDDPEMFSAIWESNDRKTSELEQMLQENVAELYRQLSALQLQNGEARKAMSPRGA